MRRRYREKIYKCGEYLEVDIFPVTDGAKAPATKRKSRYKPTSAVQARLNQRNAERALTRLLNANFTSDDISVTLTYNSDELPDTYEQAERDAKNFLRRVKRLRAKKGLPELKYVLIPGGGRYHFHIPMSGGVDDKTLQSLWGYGYLNVVHFELNEHGLEGHARYIAQQFEADEYDGEDLLSVLDIDEETGEATVRRKGKRRYSCSRNIVRPEPVERDGRISAARVEELATVDSANGAAFEAMYPGYVFAGVRPYYNAEYGGYYLQVMMYKEGLRIKKPRWSRRRKAQSEPLPDELPW